jgi:hypothetical protein
MNFMKILKEHENGSQKNGDAILSNGQLKPVNEIKRELHPAFVYIPCGLVILILLFSDGMAVAKSLTSGYGWIAYFIAFGVIGSIDMAWLGLVFCVKQLFALEKLSYAVWVFYLFIGAALGMYGFFAAVMVVDHIDALGIKQRRILSPYDYSNDPALTAVQKKMEEIRGQIDAADKTIFTLARTVEHTSNQAASFSSSLKAVFLDTNVSRQQKNNLTFYAGRANKTSAGTASTLASMQKDRQKLSTSLMIAMDELDAVNDSLVSRYAGKSAEDVVEADMGLTLKRTVAKMTQFGTIAAILVMLVFKYAYKGEWLYYPIKFNPSHIFDDTKDQKLKSESLAVNEQGKIVVIEERNEFKAGDKKEARTWLYWRVLVGEIIKGTKTEAGDLSYALKHGSVPKTLKPSFWRQIGRAERFMRENTPEEVDRVILEIEAKYGFKRKNNGIVDSTPETQPMPNNVIERADSSAV